MIPSDHFVRFYNEVFKFLAKQPGNALEEYWLTISSHQELHLSDLLKEKGMYGLKEYYDKIFEEENCDAECSATETHFDAFMHKCPSLTKAIDNDAGQMPRYCDHCPGWINPLMRKIGFFPVFDIESRQEPHCHFQVFTDEKDAKEAAKKCKWPIT